MWSLKHELFCFYTTARLQIYEILTILGAIDKIITVISYAWKSEVGIFAV
jgi:hypothetical protein